MIAWMSGFYEAEFHDAGHSLLTPGLKICRILWACHAKKKKKISVLCYEYRHLRGPRYKTLRAARLAGLLCGHSSNTDRTIAGYQPRSKVSHRVALTRECNAQRVRRLPAALNMRPPLLTEQN